ncbi:alpha/beta hydrolase [Neorhizobium sp. SHOUNA12B]|uniref:alpha/beta hydrolase n=1 Tax=Neorhizobium sp. SHOUNA12B TaxID=2908928 RepID=UPI0025CBBF4F|nr:alpha/beta hydrolase [Neorhizobium sp. SHOUNA12B]MCJ9671456.1 alpha/beta hydrolase [Neorhizobium sp. SHOUNA12B]
MSTQQSGKRWRKVLLSFCLLLSFATNAANYRLCIRGQSFEPGSELLQTRQLELLIDGPPPGDLLLNLAGLAALEKLWPTLKPEDVNAQIFEDEVCGSQPVAQVTLAYTAEQLAQISVERGRGSTDSPQTSEMLRQATVKPSTWHPPEGTSKDARRHDWLRLYFATSRVKTGQPHPSKAFGVARSDDIALGSVDVSVPADHRWANLESPSILRLEWDVDPQRHLALAPTYREMSTQQWRSELARKASTLNSPGVLVFVHGFNNTFEQSAQRAAQLAYDLAFAGPTILFSWPSNGNYPADEQQARNSHRQLAQVLNELTALNGRTQESVTVIAHSMGNRVFTEALAETLKKRPTAEGAFRQIILAAPDLSVEEFRQRWINDLSSEALQKRFTLYASDGDLPLVVSARLRGQGNLGQGGSKTAVLPPMTSIDASQITREWFGLNHSYFGDNASVMSDLFLLVNKQAPPEHRPRLRAKATSPPYWEFLK